MKKQKLFSTFRNSSLTAWQLIILSFALAFGTAQSAFAQFPREISVKVGEIKTVKGEREIVEENAKAEVGNQAIARARFDTAKKEFRIQGLKEGTTRIVFSGTYRGRNMAEAMQPPKTFSETVNVNVLSETETSANNPTNSTNPNPTNTATPNQTNTTATETLKVQINRNEIKNLGFATLLRQEPGKSIEDLELTSGDNNIARGDYDGGRTIRITGIGSGNTSLILIGKIINNNEQQSVRRIIEVTVVGDNNLNTPTDSVLESMKRTLQELKTTAAQTGTDEYKLRDSIQNFERFVRRVEAEILRESNLETPNQLREALLKNLRDAANGELKRLRDEVARIAKQIRPISWYSILSDLNMVLGAKPARRTFFCPPNPQKSYGSVWGTKSYLINSALCPAAVHAGAITFAGGNITVEFYNGRDGDKYLGSKEYGVTTDSWDRNWGYFIFKGEKDENF